MGESTASKEECVSNRLPLNWRDQCSGLLIPLNICRHKNLYAPWSCTDERHGYEKCQYDDMMRRMKLLSQQNKSE